MSRQMILAAAVAVLGLGAWYVTTPSAPTSTQSGLQSTELLVGAANAQSTDAEVDTSTIVDMQMGNPDADVTVIEYASFTCPHCATFHSGAFKQLKADFIDTDKINFIYREVYFDRYGLWASAIARCAGPEKFFGISNLIYSGQSEWTRASGGDPAAIVDELRKIGRLAGLEKDQLEACLQDSNKLKTLVAWYQEHAEADGIRSTPSFMINGKMYQNMAYGEMKGLIDDALGGS